VSGAGLAAVKPAGMFLRRVETQHRKDFSGWQLQVEWIFVQLFNPLHRHSGLLRVRVLVFLREFGHGRFGEQ